MAPLVPKNFVDWLRQGLGWRIAKYRRWYDRAILGRVAARNGLLARRLQWPIPDLVPYKKKVLDVARPGALGDVLMCTPALREVKRLNPKCRIRFFTRYKELVSKLPFIDEVHDYESRPRGSIDLRYEHTIPPQRHLAKIIGDCLGVQVSEVRPACSHDWERVERWNEKLSDCQRPLIAVSRQAGPWTPNKDWPDDSWNLLIHELCKWATVIEIGQFFKKNNATRLEKYHDYRGMTNLADLIALLTVADIHVGPVSGPVHIGAAVGTPSVVIYGGYERPECSAYAGNINLSTQPPCSPCWLRDPCPFGRSCLYELTPSKVESAIKRLWRDHPRKHCKLAIGVG